MLPKKNRVNKKDVDLLFKQGKFINSPSFTFRFILDSTKVLPCVSFITPKSIAKLAVKRNLLRRRGYNVLKNYIDQFPTDITGVFIFKKYQDDISTIENEIKNLLSKIN